MSIFFVNFQKSSSADKERNIKDFDKPRKVKVEKVYELLEENYRVMNYSNELGFLFATNIKDNGVLYISKNDGESFEEIYKFSMKIQGIYITEKNTVLVSTSPNRWENSKESAIYRSEDLKKFEKVLNIKSGAALNWNFASLENMVFVSEYGYKKLPDNARRIYKSIDDGESWRVIYNPVEINDYHNHKIIIDKQTKNIYQVFGDTQKGILKSTDFGESFQLIKKDIHPTSALIIDNSIYWGLDDSPYSGVVKQNIENDIFKTVFKAPEELGGSIYDMVKIGDKIFIFLTSYDFQKWDGAIFYSEDYGETWNEFNRIKFVPDIGVGFFNVTANNDYLYISGSIPFEVEKGVYKKYSGTLRFTIN